MITQQLIINVYKSKAFQYQAVEAKIFAVSNSGKVFIDFNQKMNIPAEPLSVISPNALNLYITEKSGAWVTNLNYTWTTLSFTAEQPSGSTTAPGF